eukprot:m51a1_g13922 hypothetical protein (179) ;mRNA; r:817396-818246
MAERASAEEPYLLVSSRQVHRTVPFEITCVTPPGWMEVRGVTVADIKDAAARSTVHFESDVDDQPIRPCTKCCVAKRKPIIAIGAHMREMPASEMGRCFVFENCFSYCNSSRLHLGDRVVVVFRIFGADGSLAARAMSQPIALLSQNDSHRKAMPTRRRRATRRKRMRKKQRGRRRRR